LPVWHGRCYYGWHVKVEYRRTHLVNGRKTVDILLIIGIVLLLVALLGVGGVIGALADVAWILLIIAVIIIAWRVITGRRPV
jgi:hypothetical protein